MKRLDNSFVGENVKYYDMFFLPEEKVSNDIIYIEEILKNNGIKNESILDVGCGTGAHAYKMSALFNHIYGLDVSQDMISYAVEHHSKKNITYFCVDVSKENTVFEEVPVWGKVDAAISLAHVIGYQCDNASAAQFLRTVRDALNVGGIFVFNFYNMPAVFLGNLQPRHTQKKIKDISLNRISNARINADESCLDLDYYYIIDDKGMLSAYEIHERMRCFTRMEMEYFLETNGFEVVNFYTYGTLDKLKCSDWNGCCVARKIGGGVN